MNTVDIDNPYYNDVVRIGLEEDAGKAWVFTAEFYYGEGGGYILYVAEYHLKNGQWAFQKQGFAGSDTNTAGYFEDRAEMMNYLQDSYHGVYEGLQGFLHNTRSGSLEELGIESPRSKPGAHDDPESYYPSDQPG